MLVQSLRRVSSVLYPSRGAAATVMRERRMLGVWWRYAIRHRRLPERPLSTSNADSIHAAAGTSWRGQW